MSDDRPGTEELVVGAFGEKVCFFSYPASTGVGGAHSGTITYY